MDSWNSIGIAYSKKAIVYCCRINFSCRFLDFLLYNSCMASPVAQNEDKDDLTPAEFAVELNISVDIVYEMIANREISLFEYGPRTRRIPVSELERIRKSKYVPAHNLTLFPLDIS